LQAAVAGLAVSLVFRQPQKALPPRSLAPTLHSCRTLFRLYIAAGHFQGRLTGYFVRELCKDAPTAQRPLQRRRPRAGGRAGRANSRIEDIADNRMSGRCCSTSLKGLRASQEVVLCHDLYVLSLVLQGEYFGGFACGDYSQGEDSGVDIADDQDVGSFGDVGLRNPARTGKSGKFSNTRLSLRYGHSRG